MSFSELVVLFDVAAPTLKATIRAIHKSGVIAEHTQHCEVMPYTYWATLYNMDMIVALAFRINSYGAEKIRTEVLKRWKIQCKLPPKTKRFCPLVLK